MRATLIEFIRDSWFTILYVAWGCVPLLALKAGIRPDPMSVAWRSAAFVYLAAGLGIVVLMFARRSAKRIRLTDLTTSRAYENSEGIPERLDHYKTRLMWERIDGFLSVALPSALAFLIVNIVLVAYIAQRSGGLQTAMLVVIPLTIGVVSVAGYMILSSGRARVERIVSKMGTVLTSGPVVDGLVRDLQMVGVAVGASHLPAVAILQSSAYNAFAVGRDVEHGTIVVTNRLAHELNASERLALLTQLTLSLRSRGSSIPSDDTRQLTEQLLDLRTVSVTCEPDGMLGLLRILSDRKTSDSAWYRFRNPLGGLGSATVPLIWPLIDMEDSEGQTADRILALDEALRSDGYYVTA